MSSSISYIIGARGPQDEHLSAATYTGSEEDIKTLFGHKWSRHTVFAFYDRIIAPRSGINGWRTEQNGTTFEMPREADLIGQVWLMMEIEAVRTSTGAPPADGKYASLIDANGYFTTKVFVDDVARAAMERTRMAIGSHEMEVITGDVLHIQETLAPSDESYLSIHASAGGSSAIETMNLGAYRDGVYTPTVSVNSGRVKQTIYVPLRFSFTKSWETYLRWSKTLFNQLTFTAYMKDISAVSILTPFSESGMRIKDDDATDKVLVTGGRMTLSLMVRFVTLGQQESEYMQSVLEGRLYLAEQIKVFENEISSAARQSFPLVTHHPTKVVLMYFKNHAFTDSTSVGVLNYWNWCLTGHGGTATTSNPQRPEPFERMTVLLGQHIHYGGNSGMEAPYYTELMPLEHYGKTTHKLDRVAVVPFALKPRAWRPTGSVNMTQNDGLTFQVQYPPGTLPSGKLMIVQFCQNYYLIKDNALQMEWQ